ncbi:MAG: hypothetical protein H7099_01130 [Gemmatimonadaceae bacterium]|nr:hypothetical protein [Gemmatimonadaceae bacterium]
MLRQAIAQVHAGYDRYMPPRVLDTAFARLERRAASPMTDVTLYHDVALLLATIRCGHTKAEYPDRLTEFRERTPTHLPVMVRIFGTRMFVARSAVPSIVRGTEIRRINGVPASDIIAKLARYAAVDGFTDFARTTLLEQDADLMGSDLDHYWPIEFGFPGVWTFVLRSATGVDRTATAAPNTFDAWKSLADASEPNDFRNGTRLVTLDDTTASLTIRSFVNYRTPVSPDSLYRSMFAELRSRHVRHLILDLRDNGGGSDDASDGLIRFLADTVIRPLRAIRRRAISFDSTLAAAFETWGDRAPIFSPSPTAFDQDSSGWFTERLRARPITPDSLRFRGRVSVLVGHRNASGATMLLAVLQQIGARTGRLRLVGAETGGSAEGPTAGQILFLRLPNSGIRVRIPLKRSDVNVASFVPGFGVFPDVDATETLTDFRRGIDRALSTARTTPWAPAVSPLAPTVGLMRGALEYRDYTSGNRVLLPTWQHTAPIGATGAFRQRVIYDDGPGNTIFSSEVLRVIGDRWIEGDGAAEGQSAAQRTTLRIASRARVGETTQLVLRGTGMDDNRRVEFRYSVTLSDTISSRLKEFRLPGKPWEYRHTYRFTRVARYAR